MLPSIRSKKQGKGERRRERNKQGLFQTTKWSKYLFCAASCLVNIKQEPKKEQTSWGTAPGIAILYTDYIAEYVHNQETSWELSPLNQSVFVLPPSMLDHLWSIWHLITSQHQGLPSAVSFLPCWDVSFVLCASWSFIQGLSHLLDVQHHQ